MGRQSATETILSSLHSRPGSHLQWFPLAPGKAESPATPGLVAIRVRPCNTRLVREGPARCWKIPATLVRQRRAQQVPPEETPRTRTRPAASSRGLPKARGNDPLAREREADATVTRQTG